MVTVEGLADFARKRAEGGCASGVCGTGLDEAQQWQARPTDSQTGEHAELAPIQQAFIDAACRTVRFLHTGPAGRRG